MSYILNQRLINVLYKHDTAIVTILCWVVASDFDGSGFGTVPHICMVNLVPIKPQRLPTLS